MIDIVHIHPMLVHFPIVLYLLAVALQWLILLRRGDLAANSCLANGALAALVLAALAAVAAAFFGDIALDHAIALGFPGAPLQTHATFGIATMSWMLLVAVLHLLARWRHWQLIGNAGSGLTLLTTAGIVLLIATAYYGGDLVYHIGVNVQGITPH